MSYEKYPRKRSRSLDRAFGIMGQMDRFVGAVRSGSPAAHLGLLLKVLGPVTRLCDRIMCQDSGKEIKDDEIPPCLILIGPPRSGSTIIYQVLVRIVPSVYLSNLHLLFPNSASSYMLRNNLFGTRLTGFKNYYGYTSSIYDVNEGNEIIKAILQDDGDDRLIRKRFSRLVKAMRATPERPLIFKNLRAYAYISHLHQAIPEIVFLRIRRNPEQIIQSVVRAYHELGYFNPVPPKLLSCKIDDPIEFAVRQILEIEQIIDLQQETIKESAWLEWWYEDFCADPWSKIEDLVENYLQMNPVCLRRNSLTEPLKVSNRVKVNADEAVRISRLLQQYS